TWDDARTEAAASTFNGLEGYLATVTVAAEEDALTRTTPDAAWIGASKATPASPWAWTTGPDAGSPLAFSMWAPNEPDGAPGHDFARFDGAAGLWDATASDDPGLTRFVVEYGGGANETATQEAVATTTLFAIAPPGAPTTVEVEPGTEAVRVSWEPPTSDGGAP